MTDDKTVTLPRELLNDLLDSARLEVDERIRSFGEDYRPHVLASLRKMVADAEAILAAPVVERQEPVDREQWWTDTPDGEAALVTRVHPAEQDGYKYRLKGRDRAWSYAKNKPEFEHEFDILPLYTSPPVPVAVKPVVWRIPVNGDWFYGTKEQCVRERTEFESTFTAEDFEDAGVVTPEPLACLDKAKELNQ